ncbi:non-ribosomal peptide synthetase [Streptomyces reniochalinae]|uniref:Amino acid adenylation domain-containing protein n=1 Tax=Streptomyces reniochalinae TaxID=2250578 RepID=A0A367ENI4_9ACTN|nr:non-ribosomal peptide synthetase [Streptomyces reniochalinae]RCG19329.1 amino acid adenylation domain-containing protein [Streptomyces reniochalinae]
MGQVGSGEGLPLTAAQTGMWYAQQLDPNNPCFRAAEALEIQGPVDPRLLERALRRTVAETEALRVRFTTDEREGAAGPEEHVRQVVEECEDWPLPLVDLRGEDDPAAAAHALMWADLDVPVDPRHARAFTFTLLRTADDRFTLYMAIHHIVMDGFSMTLFLPRLARIYTALESGDPVPEGQLAPLAQALADEADYRGSARMARDRAYWAEQLAAWGTSAHASRHWLRPARRFVRESGHLEAEAARGLRALARSARTGLATAAMAALALYVDRLGGREHADGQAGAASERSSSEQPSLDQDRSDAFGDVMLDVTVTARGGATREVPCMLANVLPLRVPAPSAGTVGDLLRRTAAQAKGLVRHQRYPFWEMVRELKAAPTLAGGMADWGINVMVYDPQVSFGRHPAVLHNLSNGPVTGMSVNVYDRPSDGSLRIDFQADPDTYPAAEVAAHHRRFLSLLRTLATCEGTRRVAEIDLATAAERDQVLAWGRGPALPVPATPLHAEFEQRVREEPDAVAVVCGPATGSTVLTRHQLNTRANRLAHLLLARGAGPGTTIALGLPRTEAYAVGLLAVLKTGAACLPLEAGHPAERTRTMLAQAAPLCVLAHEETAAHLPAEYTDGPRYAVPVVVTDAAPTRRLLETQPATDPAPHDLSRPPRQGDAAYLAFTSGSTGRPKGVVVEHRQLTHLFHDHLVSLIAEAERSANGRDGGGRKLRAGLTASFSFDTSWEAWLFLAAGHEVHLAEDGVRHDPAALVARIEEWRLDFLDLTPSYLRQLLDVGLFAPGGHQPGTLMVGGEALDQALWQRLRALPATTVLNYYGPTECTVDAVWCRLDARRDEPVLGRPQHNVRAYVLDHCGRLVPPGTRGELYLGGAQVARGYLGADALTAERFVPDPYAGRAGGDDGPGAGDRRDVEEGDGARMYRTGDLARWTDDGMLAYLGRADEQIKLRGVRIEPREVEAVLASHPRVAHVAVAAQRTGSPEGPLHLAAHIVPAPRAPGDDTQPATGLVGAELRSWAAGRLPAAMVPAVYVTHDALPLTPQGKLDRAALPTGTATAPPAADAAPRAARTPRERTLCTLFAAVLGVGETGLDDDFFALGGHSMTATRLLNRIRTELGADVSLGALYHAPTPGQLAKLLDTASDPCGTTDDAYAMLLPLRAGGGDRPLFCVHPAGGLGWCYATLAPHLPPSVPVHALQAQGLRDTGEPLAATFPGLLREYVARVRAVQARGPYRLLGWSLGGALAHAVAAHLQREGEEVELLALLDAAPIDPQLRVDPAGHPHLVRRLVTEALGSGLAEETQLSAVTRMLSHYAALLPTYTPSVYQGPALYLRATEPDPLASPSPRPTPDAWRSLITGPLTVHDLPCTHSALGEPPALARVGRLLTPYLSPGR